MLLLKKGLSSSSSSDVVVGLRQLKAAQLAEAVLSEQPHARALVQPVRGDGEAYKAGDGEEADDRAGLAVTLMCSCLPRGTN